MSINRLVFKQVSKSISVFFTFCILISCSSYQAVDHSLFQQPLEPTAILNVNVLSQDGEAMIANQNVLLENGKISQITQSDIDIKGIRVIDGSGKYLIPGLVDSHAHLQNSPNDLLVYAAHGVTYLREMSGDGNHLSWRDDISKGRLGPKIYIASRKVMSKPGIMGFGESLVRNRLNITTQADAQALVDDLIADGYQGVKISSFLDKSMYLALTKAAKEKGLEIVGHIPSSILLADLWSSGHKELAHIEEITKSLNIEFRFYNSHTADEYLAYVKSRSNEVTKKLKQHEISVGTTLWYTETIPEQVVALKDKLKNVDLTYGNPEQVARWMPGKNHFELSDELKSDPDNVKEYKKYWDAYVKAIYIMFDVLVEHNVIMLAGTDSMTSLVIPGISMHQELESLVNAGMTPAQALRSATLVPGELMKSNTGKIVEGYAADLVLLTDNPLQDIRNTKQIETVILNGKMLDKPTIDNMLRSVKVAYGHATK